MQQLNTLTDDADQIITVVLLDGSTVSLEFVYRPAIQRWTMNLTYGTTLVLNGYNLAVGPNILRPWKNLIPFGMAILSVSGLDPINLTDFLDGSVTVNVLSAAEVQQVEALLAPVPLVNP